MSRIGKNPVKVPSDVTVSVADALVSVKGKFGELKLKLTSEVTVKVEDGQVVIAPVSESKQAHMLWGTTRANIANMVQGVAEGFKKELQINGVGYRAALQGNTLVLNLGYSHDVKFPVPQGIKIACPKPTELVIEGFDKQLVGQVAAKIRGYRLPEPYKGKGIKYANEVIFRKEGKKK
ncbi:50S ribosomal protein L6 [Alphaproteobacteria bacterium]|nr:50S ribosomal protein L6 [Alphaproteobacteria bacterium]